MQLQGMGRVVLGGLLALAGGADASVIGAVFGHAKVGAVKDAFAGGACDPRRPIAVLAQLREGGGRIILRTVRDTRKTNYLNLAHPQFL